MMRLQTVIGQFHSPFFFRRVPTSSPASAPGLAYTRRFCHDYMPIVLRLASLLFSFFPALMVKLDLLWLRC